MKRAVFGLLVASGIVLGHGAANATCYFGECTPGQGAPQPTEPSHAPERVWHTVATYGKWTVRTDGQRVALMKQIDGNSYVALVKDGDNISLVLADPNWGLEEGTRFEGTIKVNDDGYRGHAVALSSRMVSFPNMSQEAVRAFFSGGTAQIVVAGQTWRVSLDGAGQAVRQAVDR